MKKLFTLLPVLLLVACGSTEEAPAPKVSRMELATGSGMSYPDFRRHEINENSDMKDAQKRFLVLDRNNDGVLSPHEFNGY